jgi:DNA (cytosine-5)-methyltransferase 1
MFEIIQAVRPDYIIGENVPGLLSIEGGMVFEQVCLDLESEGYEVQAFVLPACATGAPHRRDRVWIVAYSNEVRRCSGLGSIPKENGEISQRNENAEFGDTDSGATSNSTSNGHSGGCTETGGEKREGEQRGLFEFKGADSWINGNSKHDGPLAEQELRGNETSSDQWRQKEQNASEQPSGTDRPNDATSVHGSEKRGEQHFTQNSGSSGCEHGINDQQGNIGNFGESGTGGNERNIDAEVNSNTNESGLRRESNTQQQSAGVTGNYWHDWPSLSPFHSGHDGLSPELVRHIRTSLAEAGETPENIEAYIRKEANWLRKQAIMAAGNAVVPTVVLQVMKAIQNHYENTNH